ncbi:dipeptidyl-peptidase 3 family protein [Gallalistipes aquisgranensis]|uniref:dipeptidyl-peptidase 3 family protein n=1 Tax=Gallalistipes aquisgranensis TaxID=2779358 RepID=UPI00374346B7
MKKTVILFVMSAFAAGMTACGEKKGPAAEKANDWVVDRFDDIRVLRYEVPGFEELTLPEKKLVYYLNEAALCGRDILFDQNFRYNLPLRRTLEAIYADYPGDRTTPQWAAFEKYLKKVWFANGVHHHYSNDKFTPEFSEAYFDSLVMVTPAESFPQDFGTMVELMTVVKPVMFNPALYHKRLDQTAGQDMLAASSMNYYRGVSQKEAEAFYAAMAVPGDATPVSYGLNSQLVKEDGKLVERVWRVGGMYSPAIEKIVFWLEKAAEVAEPHQRETIGALISYYRSGDLKEFDRFNILWVQDTVSRVDFVNGFTETYGDPLGYKASWEGLVNFRNEEATRRTQAISEAAQWFEDHSPVDDRYKKKKVKGVSAKVITAAILGGDCYPATPIGINLPNADWIRKDYGSKSVTIQNITDAYDEAAKGNGFQEEFVLREEDRERMRQYGSLGDNLHTDLHECLGHGSGQLAPGVKGDELKNYGSTLEEARADLFALYYLADPKLVELGVVPSDEVAKAEYAHYVMNGLMTQLTRIKPGKDVEEAHMRNRKLISEWCYEKGRADNVIELVEQNGKTYVVVNDFGKLRALFGDLLREIQRIKSEGDFAAGRDLVETYGVKVDPKLHAEVLERYARLRLEPYAGFINPVYKPVMENGEIIDIKIEYPTDYPAQMMEYSRNYSFLPSRN